MACPCKKKKPKRKSRGCKPRRKKCFRAGIKTKNAYLNFLRDFRKTHCGLSPSQIVVAGAKVWNRLDLKCKMKYIKMAINQQKKRCAR